MSTLPTFGSSVAAIEDTFATHPLIRAINFHNTARVNEARYEDQLARYAESFSSVNQTELDQYLVTGRWEKAKPGLIISVFEGYRNSYDVLLPLLDKYGFIGWFWVITSFINAPIAEQISYANDHDIDMLTREYPDGRYAMTWEELRAIDKKHIICSHSRSHTLLTSLPASAQYQEVVGSQEDFKKHLGHPVRGFVSLTGPAFGTTPAVDKLIYEAGYDFVFSNFRIQRVRAKGDESGVSPRVL